MNDYPWSRGEESSDFLTAHTAQMRLEMMRIHRGKVGARYLARISRDMSAAAGDAMVDARDADPVRSSIARYLAGRSDGFRGVCRSSRSRVAPLRAQGLRLNAGGWRRDCWAFDCRASRGD